MDLDERQRRFSALYDAHVAKVLGYALRRTDPSSAHDVVAETFLVAWRRLDRVPVDAAPWLLAVARNTLHGLRRSEARQVVLAERVGATLEDADNPPAIHEAPDPELMAALARLPHADRELLCLLAWEDLDRAAAARVLGVSRAAFRLRLHRARRRLEIELERVRCERTSASSAAPAPEGGAA
jgi:RNA polymerase sigma-70 factor (ECF subfamily)